MFHQSLCLSKTHEKPPCFSLLFDIRMICFRSRDSVEAANPGNNLYVTGLSTRVSSSDLEKFFNKEGKVRVQLALHIVLTGFS